MSTDARKRWAELPVWPESFSCKGECGFERRGLGLQCVDGDACGCYLHPGDAHFADIDAYHRAMRRIGQEADNAD